MRPLDELAKQAQELNMGYEKPITCAEAGRKGGSARSERKTAANRANAKLPRKKAAWIEEASTSVRAMVNETTRKAAKALLGKQNARQSRLRPKVGQVWEKDGRLFETRTIGSSGIGYRSAAFPDALAGGCYDLSAWLADRKAGVIRIVRASK